MDSGRTVAVRLLEPLITAALMTAVQRLQSVAPAGLAHADWHQAVVGSRDGGTHKGQLYEVQRPQVSRVALSAAQPTASLRPGHALPTLRSHSRTTEAVIPAARSYAWGYSHPVPPSIFHVEGVAGCRSITRNRGACCSVSSAGRMQCSTLSVNSLQGLPRLSSRGCWWCT